jgi:arylsulfatase
MLVSSQSRREFIESLVAGSVGASLGIGERVALSSGPTKGDISESGRPDDRPNILLIMADDMGFSDIGCYGGEIDTPHADELAEDGLRFSQFYNAARCCPTRASTLTGLYPHQAGMGFMMSEGDDLGLPGYRSHLNDSCVTIAEVLRQEGYNTAMSGKWHLGTERAHRPTNRGFDYFSGILEGSCDYFDPGEEALAFSRNERVDLGGEAST